MSEAPVSLPDGKLLYTNGEVREMLGIGNSKLFELIRDGYLDSLPLGARGKRITRESIERLLQGEAAESEVANGTSTRSGRKAT